MLRDHSGAGRRGTHDHRSSHGKHRHRSRAASSRRLSTKPAASLVMHHPFRLLAALLLGISSLLPTGCDNAKPPAPEAAAATPTPSPALEDEEPELAEDDTPEAKPVDTGEP